MDFVTVLEKFRAHWLNKTINNLSVPTTKHRLWAQERCTHWISFENVSNYSAENVTPSIVCKACSENCGPGRGFQSATNYPRKRSNFQVLNCGKTQGSSTNDLITSMIAQRRANKAASRQRAISGIIPGHQNYILQHLI